MKKRILATLFVFAVLTSILVACGKKAEESVKEEPETPVVEEAKTELEQVVEEKESEEKEVEEPDEWRETYLEELENLGDEWKGEDSSYGMIYVNDDDIPEIITRRSGTQSDALYISTYNSNEKKVETVGYLSSGLVVGGILITPENIEKTLGLSSESTESKKQTKESDNSLYTVEVTAPDGYVNFRTGAGTDYEIISPISNGEQLSVITDEGKWLQVEYQGKTGWVASSQVTKTP